MPPAPILPEASYGILPPKRPNPQLWRYASLLAFGLTCLLLATSTAPPAWPTILKHACIYAYLCTYLDTSYKDGARAWPWFQRLGIWRYYVGYLKGKVVCTTPLDANTQYIFGAHPHGISTWSHFLTMTDGCRFLSDQYPRPRRDLGATVLFFLPFFKDMLLWLGCVDAGATTAHAILARGYSSLIYVGGEKEQIWATRGQDIVVVLPRKGFLKLALQYGCPVVPSYAFNESDLYFTFNYLKDFQLWVASTFKLAFPPCWGCVLPWLPLPLPVTVVMGTPLAVKKTAHPSKEEVEALHTRYMVALTELFDANKVKFGGRSKEAKLVIK